MIHTGSCSWTEKTLIKSGEFYPVGIKASEDRLRHYAGNFDTVEVDSSYYAIPEKRTALLWEQRTPDNFIFHIKAYAALTGHGIDPRTLPQDMHSLLTGEDSKKDRLYIKESFLLKAISDRFTESLMPLWKSHKLGLLIFQFPPWFQYSHKSLDYILTCKELMNGLTLAVEFRHGSWLTPDKVDSTFNFLRKNQITYITADEPQYGNLTTVPFLLGITTDTAYFRLHGRNSENWLKRGIETSLRYDYLYTDDELKGFLPEIEEAGRRAKAVYVMFNNCHGASAVKNALRMRELLETI